MATGIQFSLDSRIALTTTEVSRLDVMLKAGDRAGYYMAYYAMTENQESLQTAQVSTFSESTGGAAYAANSLLQNAFRTTGPSALTHSSDSH